MKNTNFTLTYRAMASIFTFVIIIVLVFGFVTKANAYYQEYGDFGWGNSSYDYYEPMYDYSYDYYEPMYDNYQPQFNFPSYQIPNNSFGFNNFAFSTPIYNTPIYPYPSYGSVGPINLNSSNLNSNSNINNNNNNNVNNVNVVVGTPITGSTPNIPVQQNLDGDCYISPSTTYTNQNVTFNANATGGNGSYTYNWNGSDGISSSARSFTGKFGSSGTKTATVTITSQNQSITRSCSVFVQHTVINNQNLSLYCIANSANVGVNQVVTWTAYASGGNGYYTYSWNGTDGLSYGNSQSIQKSYTSGGQKFAYATVYDNQGRSAQATCSINIIGGTPIGGVTVIRDNINYGTPVSGVYLGQVPATGINPSFKITLFAFSVLLWSLALGYLFVSKKKSKELQLNVQTASLRIEAFKRSNLEKRR